MKSIPTLENSSEKDYLDFYANETEKIKYGLTIGGVYIHGWLYWHLNMWKMWMDIKDERDGSVIRAFKNPYLRDNEWLIAEKLKQAEDEKKGLFIAGARRLGKSIVMSSYIGRSATIHKGSENVIVGNNKSDLGVLTSLCDKGLLGLPDYYKWGRINDDWSKEVTLGYKDRKGTREEWSKIFIRNTNGGLITEVVAGTTPKSLVFDEVAKSPMAEVFAAAKPAFESPYGWRACPLLFCTGGDADNSGDAEMMFNDPDIYNMVSMILPEEGNKKTCIFIPGSYSLQFDKVPMSLAEFTNAEKGTELDTIKIDVSTHELNNNIINERRKELEKAKNSSELMKYKMYLPITSDECFITDTGNNFPVDQAQKMLDLIMRKPELQGTPVKIERDITTNKLVAKEVPPNTIVWSYPHDKNGNLNAPIVIYEKPIENPPLYLYIAGIDPYNTSKSSNSSSLGTCVIYKRLYDLVGGTFQQRIVATYAARPETLKEWCENVEYLLEYYNAVAMMENEGTTFLNHMDNKNKAHYLADGFSLLKEISPNTSIQGRNKGLPATRPVINHCMDLLVEYCKEEVLLGADEEGNPIKTLGVSRIPDPVLLQEIIQYREKANVDRIVAFRHVLAFDRYLDKSFPLVNVHKKDAEKKEVKHAPRSPFSVGTGNLFGRLKRNPFK